NKTNTVNNIDFLRSVFGNESNDAHPLVVSFKGDPRKVDQKYWFSKAWINNTSSIVLTPDSNNYFSLAKYRPDEKGQYRRKKTQFCTLHAVMLDDIGTKVPIERITLSPSWLL